ncbi:fumarylacetoacetate hydrolase family protein [Amycolatopsis pithecellobii]|uniref:Fumarylacetoacetate hydrolase n=1 Tax=Amycolatopsis pithecellobii TaxID=664692 RepID=A0A6N7Z2N6_9PSEU|nr:fumarylacetoacetate hydrolase family protein [Amycolatopsis pithecellobii]MTD54321.1 fumarylacetoacetate hydrolase [Amycolatopsis pithecellobii]
MKLLNAGGRLWAEYEGGFFDVAESSGGRFDPDPQAIFDRWAEFRDWVSRNRPAGTGSPATSHLGSPVPRPRQVFAVGFNYADHSGELGAGIPARPLLFPKLPTCVSGPADVVTLAGAQIDWEVELVVVMGKYARGVKADTAWRYVAGLTVGQDLSDRAEQFAGETPQFSLAKSRPGFGPLGPWLVTVDDFADPEDLAITCLLNGEIVQESRTKHLVFGVGTLIEFLSARVPLLPGDVIFTGTPSGIGFSRTPPRFLREDDVLVGRIEGIGDLVTRFEAGKEEG